MHMGNCMDKGHQALGRLQQSQVDSNQGQAASLFLFLNYCKLQTFNKTQQNPQNCTSSPFLCSPPPSTTVACNCLLFDAPQNLSGKLPQASTLITLKQFKYQSQTMNIQLSLCYLLAVLCLICGVMGKGLPISFLSAQHPKAVFIKLEVEEKQSFGLWSPRINQDGDHWITVSTQTDQLVFNPPVDAQTVLFNERHDGKHVLAFYGQLNDQKDQEQFQHFNIIQTEKSGQLVGFLLPLFSNEVPSFRSDKLFRCQNTVISVEWRGDEAHIVAFSQIKEQWNILESIDGGYAGEDKGVRYSYAIDREHSQPVKVDLLGGQYCNIDQSTQAMQLGHSWESDYLSLDGLLQLLPHKLDVKGKADSEEL